MPTIEYQRLWCTKCKDWELFELPWGLEDRGKKELVCKKCGTVHTPTKLSEIPKEKLLEQRERYNEKQKESYTKLFGEFMMTQEERNIKEIMHMFSEPGSDVYIIESDAGQREIDKIEREARWKGAQEREAAKEEARQKLSIYRKVQRNDTCPCGSGKKYKKCHLNENNALMLEHNLRF
jgi:uncharacterized protein YecA (UPF0149 family)